MASGTVDVSEVYEGIEAENILVEGGELNISCKDDGFNATSTASGSGITVNDGTISIINTGGRDADGMDSNRDICINGGTIFVSVPSDGNALDCGSENGGKTVITGGSLIACGGTMMAESPDESTTQPTFMQGIQGNEGDVIRLETSDGEEILNKTVPNSFSAVTVSLPEFKQGLTYKLICGDQTKEITFTETVMITDISDNPMGGGGPGGGGPAGGGHP